MRPSTNRRRALELIKTLTLALTGIRAWVEKLEVVSDHRFAMATGRPSFVNARMDIPNAKRAPSELVMLIEQHCGRGSGLRVEWTITGYLCVVKALILGGSLENTPQAKRDALLSLLQGTFVTSPVCNPDEARAALAASIAHLVP